MATIASPEWDRYFGRAPLPADAVLPTPAVPGEVRIIWYPKPQAAPTPRPATPQASLPPTTPPPTRPTSQRPLSPEPPRRAKELAWLTSQLSDALRKQTKARVREMLRWRAQECGPLPEPEQPVARSRFGLYGEQLAPLAGKTLCVLIDTELREIVRTVEAPLSWSQRNYRLVMHSARLGQLCAALERRGSIDVLEVIRAGLEPLWA